MLKAGDGDMAVPAMGSSGGTVEQAATAREEIEQAASLSLFRDDFVFVLRVDRILVQVRPRARATIAIPSLDMCRFRYTHRIVLALMGGIVFLAKTMFYL
jgi:hypothetical protein